VRKLTWSRRGVEGCGERGRVSPRIPREGPANVQLPAARAMGFRECSSQTCALSLPWITRYFPTFEYRSFFGESGPQTRLSVSCDSAAKASTSFGKILEYFMMPTMVNTFVQCCDKPNVDTFCPEFEASISI
jgi:hypothetical protein